MCNVIGAPRKLHGSIFMQRKQHQQCCKQFLKNVISVTLVREWDLLKKQWKVFLEFPHFLIDTRPTYACGTQVAHNYCVQLVCTMHRKCSPQLFSSQLSATLAVHKNTHTRPSKLRMGNPSFIQTRKLSISSQIFIWPKTYSICCHHQWILQTLWTLLSSLVNIIRRQRKLDWHRYHCRRSTSLTLTLPRSPPSPLSSP